MHTYMPSSTLCMYVHHVRLPLLHVARCWAAKHEVNSCQYPSRIQTTITISHTAKCLLCSTQAKGQGKKERQMFPSPAFPPPFRIRRRPWEQTTVLRMLPHARL